MILNVENNYESKKTYEIIEKIIPSEDSKYNYFTKKELLMNLEKLQDVRDKFILYALFLGIKGEEYRELTHLKLEDLDKDKKRVELITGRYAKVDNLFIEIMISAEKCEYYDKDSDEHSGRGRKDLRKYTPNGYILKQMKRGEPEPISSGRITMALATIRKQTECHYLSEPSIIKSGRINFIQEMYYMQYGITIKQAMLEKFNKKEYIYAKQTQDYINEFGALDTDTRQLRNKIKKFISYFELNEFELYNKSMDNEIELSCSNFVLDKIAIIRNGFDIPRGAWGFWGSSSMGREFKYFVKFLYLGIEYNAYILRNSNKSLRTTLFWQEDLDKLIRSKFSDIRKYECGNEDNPILHFEKIEKDKYNLQFILPEYINIDIESESEETILSNNKEGKTTYYYSKKYERNKNNRKAAMKEHGTKCACCDFDFEQTYGERGMGHIEIHHKKPLYTLEEEVQINSKEDLIPVCANCHRIIHKIKGEVLTVDEVRKLIEKNKSNTIIQSR